MCSTAIYLKQAMYIFNILILLLQIYLHSKN